MFKEMKRGRKRLNKKMEESPRDLWHSIKKSTTCIIRVPGKEKIG
jgi:hypothetical protein